jgi:hypothetical protein
MGQGTFPQRAAPFHSIDHLGIRMMSNWLLAIAWGSALASLYLIADMIMTDVASRRALAREGTRFGGRLRRR